MAKQLPITSVSQAFTADLPYEIDMLRNTYERLLNHSLEDNVGQNALIESFCVHARNLLEFFNGHREAIPVFEMVDANYKPISLNALYGRLSEQINDLSSGREGAEKINATDPQIIGSLEREISRFKNHLKPEFREKFRCQTTPVKISTGLPKVTDTTTALTATFVHQRKFFPGMCPLSV
jgi:hypothetical protein